MALALPVLALFALALSSCSGTFWLSLGFGAGSPDISGTIADAQGLGYSFSGATVTLSNTTTGDTYTATVNSSNQWSVSSAKTGTYTASVSLAGDYYFTPLTAPFSYSGGSITAPTIAGLYTGGLGSSYVFILMWNNTQQLNLYLTGPDGTYTGSAPTLNFSSPNYDLSYNNVPPFSTYWNNGFGPNGNPPTANPIGRLSLPTTSSIPSGISSAYAVLGADASTYGPVAITFKNYLTTDSNGFYTAGSTQAPLGSSYWQGVLNFYIDASSSGGYISSSSSTTNATLYAIGADSSGNPLVLGIYTVPTNTTIQTIEALRINIFNSAFQLVPEMQLVAPGGIRTVAGTSGSGIVSVPRAPLSK